MIKNVLCIVLWSAGVWLIWAYVEPEPRWHNPWNDTILGNWDERTIVTASTAREAVPGTSGANWARGPVRFRDLKTGIVHKECLGPGDRFGRVCMDKQRRFMLEDRIDSEKKTYRLRLYDADVDQEIASFNCRANSLGLVWWEISPEGAISALEHHDHTGPSITFSQPRTTSLRELAIVMAALNENVTVVTKVLLLDQNGDGFLVFGRNAPSCREIPKALESPYRFDERDE